MHIFVLRMAIPESRGQILVEMAKVLCKEKRPVAENDDESEEEPFQSSGSEYIPSEETHAAVKKKLKSIIMQDDRGVVKSGGRNKCSPQQIQSVLNHINSFPTYISHYCRRETEAKYLHPDLNLAKMYDLYKEFSGEDTLKDTCLACDTYKAEIVSLHGEERKKLEKQHKEHIDKAQALRNTMNADLKDAKSNEQVETFTFDSQKNASVTKTSNRKRHSRLIHKKTHPLPKLPTGKAYYLCKLNFYNLGIHIGSTNRAVFNVWTENIAGRGSTNRAVFNVWTENIAGRGTQEVGSCLLKYMKNNIRAPVKELRLWSDSCGG
ncbi:hypothetical protein QE152_g8006 [Popillia japonica]|uniref:Uncharacterized protein n=1 Tax=Popillia japonica TaxID=7064 RepID=A0AAW1MD56_POPJA